VISLKAPLSGLVTHVDARLGDPIDPEKAMLEITDLSEVYAVARVPEHQAGRMKTGTWRTSKSRRCRMKSSMASCCAFGTSADKASGTIDAIFRLPNTGGQLRADMRAEFSIVMSKRSNVVSVPRAALQGEGGNRFVYVKDFDLANAFVKTAVTVGEINDRFVEITNGLLPADEVVTRGAYSLSFAGASSVSLKEALDAAHGHEHAADGGELTPEKKAEMEAAKRAVATGMDTARKKVPARSGSMAAVFCSCSCCFPSSPRKAAPKRTKPQPRNPLKRRLRKPCSTK
jgi:cobalt-zinc-cadmium efflux system membrane fusion protein